MQMVLKTNIDKIALTVTDFVITKRIIFVLFSLLLALVFILQTQYIGSGNNYRAFFSKENPELTAFEDFQDTYTKNDNVFFLVLPKHGGDVFTPEVMTAVADLTEQSWQIPYSIRVDSVTNFQYTYAEEDDLVVENLIPDPQNLGLEEYKDKKSIALAEPILKSQLVSYNAKATAVNVVIQYPELSDSEVFEVASQARELRDRITDAHPAVDVRLTGVAMLNVSFTESGQRDFSTLVPSMFGVVLLLSLLTLRSFSLTGVIMLIVLISVIVAIGSAGMMRIAITPLELSSVIVVLTLAVADSIHILLTLREKMKSGLHKMNALREAMRINYLAVAITSLTTIVGFLALNFSDAPPFRNLGNMSAMGIGAAWLFSITLLPALVSFLPLRVKASDQDAAKPKLMEWVGRNIVMRKGTCAGFAALFSIFLVSQTPKIEFNDQWTKYFSERIPFRTASDTATQYFGLYPVEFSVPAAGEGGVLEPEYLNRLDEFADWLREQSAVTHVYSISDIMKRLNRNLNQDDPAFYRLPEERTVAAQYLLLYELSLPYGLDLNDRINIDKSESRVTATLGNLNAGQSISTKETKEFLEDSRAYIEEHFPEGQRSVPTSTQVMFTYITDRNIEQMFRGTIIAIVAISIIMISSLRSFSLGLLSLVPNALPILTAFGAWALIVGEVGFSIAMIAAISLGIVVDDTVHLMTKYLRARREDNLSPEEAVIYAFRTVGLAIVINTIILSVGFALLMISTFKVVVDMGLLTSMAIVFAMIIDFLLLPALLIWTDRGTMYLRARGEKDDASKYSIAM